MPDLVDWNRLHLGGLAGHPLADSRCRIVVGDVYDTLRQSPATFDVIVLDVDNGPQGLTQAKNQRIYSEGGVRVCLAALRPNGVLAVWSQGPNAGYRRKLERHATDVEVLRVAARAGSDVTHVVFVGKTRARGAERARS
jgi:spermidine synthase